MKERDINDYFKIFKRDITKFVELKIDYLKLEFTEVFATVFSKILTLWVTLIAGLIFVTFLLVALGLFLGHVLGAYYWGFLIVAGVFLLFVVLFIAMRKTLITNPLINVLISSIFENQFDKNRKNDEYEKE